MPCARYWQYRWPLLLETCEIVPMISVATEHPFSILAPAGFLIEPRPAKELTDACIVGLFLRRFKRDEAVKVLVDGCRLTRATVSRIRRAMPGAISDTDTSSENHLNSPIDVMLVSNIPEEPNLVLWDKHCHAQRMYWSVAKPFIVEAPASIQPVKVLLIRLASKEIQVTDLEIRKKLAIIVVATVARIQKPIQVSVRMDQLRVGIDE